MMMLPGPFLQITRLSTVVTPLSRAIGSKGDLRSRKGIGANVYSAWFPTLKNEEKDMSDKITLVVSFHMDDSAKEEFTAKLRDVFTHIVKEETFVEASLVQDMRDPKSILNYEVWNESPESFIKNQMSKAYRAEFEKMIVDLKIDRTAAWYSTIAYWKKA
jgi:quinol monooxygenase YgiN